ncbi:unnamed protein product [Paramecium octaurelia]|uniref:Uncharacterized protein n=1 Tax=Paramecium octaurelia TaxID=43137 RepID=A0A8S1TD50_PAROT|nr:unnamed protein product [Paramecium octaurelia]
MLIWIIKQLTKEEFNNIEQSPLINYFQQSQTNDKVQDRSHIIPTSNIVDQNN